MFISSLAFKGDGSAPAPSDTHGAGVVEEPCSSLSVHERHYRAENQAQLSQAQVGAEPSNLCFCPFGSNVTWG